MTGGFSGKRRKMVRRAAGGARTRDLDRISNELRYSVIEALEAYSTKFIDDVIVVHPTTFAPADTERAEKLGFRMLRRSKRRSSNLFDRRSQARDKSGGADETESIVVFDAADFDIVTKFDEEVAKLACASENLAEERRATIIALAEMSAIGDRIDRVQSENRAALDHLLAC